MGVFANTLQARVASDQLLQELNFSVYAVDARLKFDESFHDIGVDDATRESHVMLRGEYASWRYFMRYAEEVAFQFQFQLQFESENSEKSQNQLVSDNKRAVEAFRACGLDAECAVIGVHLLLGAVHSECEPLASACRPCDPVVQAGAQEREEDWWESGEQLRLRSRRFLEGVVEHFRKRFPRAHYLVVSDDVNWTRRTLDASGVRGDSLTLISLASPTAAGADTNPNNVINIEDPKRSLEALAFLSSHAQHVAFNGALEGYWAAFLVAARRSNSNPNENLNPNTFLASETLYCAPHQSSHAPPGGRRGGRTEWHSRRHSGLYLPHWTPIQTE